MSTRNSFTQSHNEMPTITAYKGSKDGIPKQTKITKPDTLEEDYVLLEVTASGLCGTDLHYVSNPSYPRAIADR